MLNISNTLKLKGIIPLAFVALSLMGTTAFSTSESNLINQLGGLSAQKALALANQWHWEKQPVRTHITSSEVVFEFESGAVKRIALPKEEMMVAVAPYIKNTHE